MRIVTFKVEESVLKEIDELARFEGVSRSEIIREALMNYLSRVKRELRVRRPVRVRRVILT